MTNKIGDLIYYKKPIEKSHNQQTENILCEIIKSNDDNIVTLKRIFSKDNEVNEWEIKNEDLGLKTENVWTDVKHIISAGFIVKFNYLQLNNIFIFKPGCNYKESYKNIENNNLNSLGVFLMTKDFIKPFNCDDYMVNGVVDFKKFNSEYKVLTHLNDFIDFLESEKIEYNLNEMLLN